MGKDQMPARPHIVMLPSSGVGHLAPMIEFAKRILSHRDVSITFVTVSGMCRESSLADLSEHPSIRSLTLPPVDTADLTLKVTPGTILAMIIQRSLEPLGKLLGEIQPISAFILDFFCTTTLDVVKELGVPAYVFFPSPATVLSFLLYLPILHEQIPGEFRDLEETVSSPGTPPFRGTDLIASVQDRQNDSYKWLLYHCRRYREVDGILVNSFEELEPKAWKALSEAREYEGAIPPVYPIGPLVKSAEADAGNGREACLRWLDGQPRGSVLFISFGSGGTLEQEQVAELALGLEASGQRFLWVVRRPRSLVWAAYFGTGRVEENGEDLACFLPDGFLERTAKVGLVVPDWAPQMKVLSHEAVGGFFSHCGWNSTLESVVSGVPMIGWPLFAEQKMNAQILKNEIGISLNVDYEKGLVTREEIKEVIRLLFESETGKKLRKRVTELKGMAHKALSEKGFSCLARLADQWASPR